MLDGHSFLSSIVFVLSCLVMIGLSEVAIAMSDPFGDDESDFDLNAFLEKVYNNATAFLRDNHDTLGMLASKLPLGMLNPLDPANAHMATWCEGDDSLNGLVDRRKTRTNLIDNLSPMRNLSADGKPLAASPPRAPPLAAAPPPQRAAASPTPQRAVAPPTPTPDAATPAPKLPPAPALPASVQTPGSPQTPVKAASGAVAALSPALSGGSPSKSPAKQHRTQILNREPIILSSKKAGSGVSATRQARPKEPSNRPRVKRPTSPLQSGGYHDEVEQYSGQPFPTFAAGTNVFYERLAEHENEMGA